MPTGKTETGVDAEGSVVLIYYQQNYLMGRETSFLSDSSEYSKDIDLNESFLSPGSIENKIELLTATTKFSNFCQELEKLLPDIPKITFADVRNSRSRPGYIAAKPRYVLKERRTLFGFPKGSYEFKDNDLITTAFREIKEETSIELNKEKLQFMNKIAPTGRGSHYAVYHYKLTKKEYDDYNLLIDEKNKSRENELHDLQFIKIPKVDPRSFFINVVSKEAYERTIKANGIRKTRRQSNAAVRSGVK